MINFEGIDPILRLYSKYNIKPSVDHVHPVFSISGIFNRSGNLLNFVTPMDVKFNNPLIVLVGCGGTGSHLLPDILQFYMSYIKNFTGSLSDLNYNIVLIDGDVVEQKNLIRQRFTESDVEMYKSEALAKRYSSVFSTKISHSTKYLTSSDQIDNLVDSFGSNSVIFLGAVDNHRARAVMLEYFNKTSLPIAWIDAGNESWHGQVILGTKNVKTTSRETVDWNEAKIGDTIKSVDLPHFFDIYPEEFLLIGGQPEEPQQNCADRAAVDPQTIHANSLSAQCASNLFSQLITGTVRTSSLYFDALTGNVKATHIGQVSIAENMLLINSSREKINSFLEGLSMIGSSLRMTQDV